MMADEVEKPDRMDEGRWYKELNAYENLGFKSSLINATILWWIYH